MEGHEQRPDDDAKRPGHDRPAERQAKPGADEADRDREVLEVPQEPEGRLVPQPAVALLLGHPVDRASLDLAHGRGLGWRGVGELWRRGQVGGRGHRVSSLLETGCVAPAYTIV